LGFALYATGVSVLTTAASTAGGITGSAIGIEYTLGDLLGTYVDCPHFGQSIVIPAPASSITIF
jgi:uncharacterized membrane-anchored protein YitT (DUF2179 family)